MFKTIQRTLIGGLFLIGAATSVQADVKLGDGTLLPENPYFIVTYVEAGPANADKVAGMIKAHAARTAGKPGAIKAEGIQQIGRKNQFIILETWSDKAAREVNAAAADTIAFRKALQPLLYSPYDERVNVGFVAGDPKSKGAAGGSPVYVVTHVDIIPPEQFPPCKRQVNEAGPCGNDLVKSLVLASRGHDGSLRFDALTQANRPNHMTVVEVWDSAKSQAAHTVTQDVRNFRDGLAGIPVGSGVQPDPTFLLNPLSGSLYDEGIYTPIQ